MTPEEFAADHGLSVEEARLILERRSLPKPLPGGRLAQAMEALAKALGKTGVAPVRVNAEGILEKSEFPDRAHLYKFYPNKDEAGKAGGTYIPMPNPRPLKIAISYDAEEQSQDPEDWK